MVEQSELDSPWYSLYPPIWPSAGSKLQRPFLEFQEPDFDPPARKNFQKVWAAVMSNADQISILLEEAV
jgi:hypothetical protein